MDHKVYTDHVTLCFEVLKNTLFLCWNGRDNTMQVREAIETFLRRSMFNLQYPISYKTTNFFEAYLGIITTLNLTFEIASALPAYIESDDSPVDFLNFIKELFKDRYSIIIKTLL